VGMGVALMLDQGQLADPPIGLAKVHAALIGQPPLRGFEIAT
jgi:hypothetical protein